MSLSHVLGVCKKKNSLAMVVSQITFTPAVMHAISVVAREKKVLITASTAPITLVNTSRHDKQSRSSFLTSMGLILVLRILNVTALSIGSTNRKSAGHALIAVRLFHGTLLHVTTAGATWHPHHTNYQAGKNSCAASCSLRRIEKEERKTKLFSKCVAVDRATECDLRGSGVGKR